MNKKQRIVYRKNGFTTAINVNLFTIKPKIFQKAFNYNRDFVDRFKMIDDVDFVYFKNWVFASNFILSLGNGNKRVIFEHCFFLGRQFEINDGKDSSVEIIEPVFMKSCSEITIRNCYNVNIELGCLSEEVSLDFRCIDNVRIMASSCLKRIYMMEVAEGYVKNYCSSWCLLDTFDVIKLTMEDSDVKRSLPFNTDIEELMLKNSRLDFREARDSYIDYFLKNIILENSSIITSEELRFLKLESIKFVDKEGDVSRLEGKLIKLGNINFEADSNGIVAITKEYLDNLGIEQVSKKSSYAAFVEFTNKLINLKENAINKELKQQAIIEDSKIDEWYEKELERRILEIKKELVEVKNKKYNVKKKRRAKIRSTIVATKPVGEIK